MTTHRMAHAAGSLATILALLVAAPCGAQSLAARVAATEGLVQVVYPSRPNVCGDGERFISNVLNRSSYWDGNSGYNEGSGWPGRPCVHGPARTVATVVGGEVTRLHTYVGPVPPARADVKTISASAGEAASWLGDIVSRGSSRVASDAMLPLVIADAPDPWPLLLRVARDENRPRDVRRSTLMWLSSGVSDHLGIADAHDDTPDDEMRSQAVFVLSQRQKSESVPELMDLARNAKHPSARRAAIFWLGQTGDMRAADVYAELLGIR